MIVTSALIVADGARAGAYAPALAPSAYRPIGGYCTLRDRRK